MLSKLKNQIFLIKRFSVIALFSITLLNATAQQPSISSSKKFSFSELTFHSSPCKETCPDISLSINSNKRIELVRVLYKATGQVDSILSGAFKGTIKNKDYNKLIRLLKNCDFDSLKFPEVLCCDSSIKTIILSYNGKYKRFKSMIPPQEVNNLITFLMHLAKTISLPKYKGAIDFEE